MRISDRIRETTLTTGTGAITLAGAAVGYRAFSAVYANGDKVPYCISRASEWEVGIGVWNTGGTITRSQVLASSNADALVNFSAGSKDVFATLPGYRADGRVRIAILSDSGAGQAVLMDQSWPKILEDRLNSRGGASVEVKNFGIYQLKFSQANASLFYGTLTPNKAVIAWKPDVVIIAALGQADLFLGATLAATKIEADACIAELRAGLPSALLIYQYNLSYDSANFTPATVLNKGTLGGFMTLKSSGILANAYCSEMLDDAVGATNRTYFQDYSDLKTYILANASVTGGFTTNVFKIARLGLLSGDNAHFILLGHALAAGYAYNGLRAIAAFTALTPIADYSSDPNNPTFIHDPDTFFTKYLAVSGTGYTPVAPNSQSEAAHQSWGRVLMDPYYWYLVYKPATFNACGSVSPVTLYNSLNYDGLLLWSCNRSDPFSTVSYSIDGGAFVSTTVATDFLGGAAGAIQMGALGIASGTKTFRFKVGASVFGPYTFTLAAPTVGIYFSTFTPAQLTTNQNDYNPSGANYWRMSSDASRTITGIVAGAAGAQLAIANVGIQPIVIANDNASSAAANRILTDTSTDITLRADDVIEFLYDATTARWRTRHRPPKQIYKRLGSQFATASTTGADVTGFNFPLDANEQWTFEFDMRVGKVTTTTGISFAITFPAGATLMASAIGTTSSTSAFLRDVMTTTATLGATFHTIADLNGYVRISGTVITAATAGTLQLQLATVTSNNASVEAGSSLRAWGSVAA